MSTSPLKVFKLREYHPSVFRKNEISAEIGEAIWQQYRHLIDVDFPSPKTEGQWRLTAKGWIGQIPLPPYHRIVLQPKVPLGNVFRMLEYAYRMKKAEALFPPGMVTSGSLVEFFENLVSVLAKQILERGRKGFYRAYCPDEDRLPYLRGRLDIYQKLRNPSEPRLPCQFEEHSADLAENQLLFWTISRLARCDISRADVLANVRRAYRSLQGFATLTTFSPQDCVGRLYNRLNDDYEPMHALCRFLLEHTGPTHASGDRDMVPFLINMNRLFELFVAQWLDDHLPDNFDLRTQEKIAFVGSETLCFQIDLVLFDRNLNRPVAVMDTKYKAKSSPSSDDIAQVVAYAESTGCREAVLIYPRHLPQSATFTVGKVRVRTLAFSLGDELDVAGQALISTLMHGISNDSQSPTDSSQ
ncbi:McrC family protein [Symmachiella dynata]|uniref:McrC family protein n=1 Tax=Symmachiella dynata TaxID=2527995 RepID=UPI0030EB471C